MVDFKSFWHHLASQYRIEENNFEKAFFSFFGLVDNPFNNAVKKIQIKNVNDALKQDWDAVMNDLNRVFKKEVEAINVEE